MKSNIDNKNPRHGTHLRTKAKKNALMEERIDQIETELLLPQKFKAVMPFSLLKKKVSYSPDELEDIVDQKNEVERKDAKVEKKVEEGQEDSSTTQEQTKKIEEKKDEAGGNDDDA